jgi:hypothetical protein
VHRILCIFSAAKVSSSFSALISIAFVIAYLFVMLNAFSGRTLCYKTYVFYTLQHLRSSR